MFININRFASLCLLLTCVIACSAKTRHGHDKELLSQKVQQTDSQFKEWLIDTLRTLGSSVHSDNANRIVKYQLTSDSLQLDIFENYQFVFDKNYKQIDENTRYVFSLLKEYAEMPRFRSTISFAVHHTYYPSVLKEFNKEFVESVEDIKVETSDVLTEYVYIRGRLSDKYITIKKDGGQKLHYEFIWEDDKIIKRKI